MSTDKVHGGHGAEELTQSALVVHAASIVSRTRQVRENADAAVSRRVERRVTHSDRVDALSDRDRAHEEHDAEREAIRSVEAHRVLASLLQSVGLQVAKEDMMMVVD